MTKKEIAPVFPISELPPTLTFDAKHVKPALNRARMALQRALDEPDEPFEYGILSVYDQTHDSITLLYKESKHLDSGFGITDALSLAREQLEKVFLASFFCAAPEQARKTMHIDQFQRRQRDLEILRNRQGDHDRIKEFLSEFGDPFTELLKPSLPLTQKEVDDILDKNQAEVLSRKKGEKYSGTKHTMFTVPELIEIATSDATVVERKAADSEYERKTGESLKSALLILKREYETLSAYTHCLAPKIDFGRVIEDRSGKIAEPTLRANQLDQKRTEAWMISVIGYTTSMSLFLAKHSSSMNLEDVVQATTSLESIWQMLGTVSQLGKELIATGLPARLGLQSCPATLPEVIQ